MLIPYLRALLVVYSDKGLHGIVALSSSVAAPASIQAGAWPAAITKLSCSCDAQQLQHSSWILSAGSGIIPLTPVEIKQHSALSGLVSARLGCL